MQPRLQWKKTDLGVVLVVATPGLSKADLCADPARRLRIVGETTTKLKKSEGARAASLIIEASGWVPPTVNRVLGQMGSALGPVNRMMPQRMPWNMVISNVPGPPMPVYLLGRRLEAIHPFVALSPQRRALAIGVISYDGKLIFGLVIYRAAIDIGEAGRNS